MGIFFLAKEETAKIGFARIVVTSLIAHGAAWITVFAAAMVGLLAAGIAATSTGAEKTYDAGQGEGVFLGMALVPMMVSFPLSLMVAPICRKVGFFAFGASLLVGSGIGVMTALLTAGYLLSLISAVDLLGNPEIQDSIGVLSLIGVMYGATAATWFWIILRMTRPKVFAEDWVLRNPARRPVIYLPFALVFAAWLLFEFGVYNV